MSTAANVTTTTTTQSPATIMNGAGDAEFSIEDLIPTELKSAVEKQDNGTEGGASVSPVLSNDSHKTQSSKAQKTDEEVIEEIEEEEESTTAAFQTASDEELDLSDESVEELLKGDPSKVMAKKTTTKADTEEEEFPWKTEAEYAELAQRLSFNGATPEALDKLIKKVVDSAVINNSTLTNSYRDKVKTLEQNSAVLGEEIKRLKAIERNAYFENAEETKAQFDLPMAAAEAEVSKVLKIEGSDVSAKKILDCDNRLELNKIITNEALDDDAAIKITNQWKAYNQLRGEREAARAEARKNLQQGLSTKVDDKRVTKVYQNSLGDILEDKQATQYDYIRKAVESGEYDSPDHADAKSTLLQSQRDHKSLLQALANPADHVNNPDWMNKLAKFAIASAHARNMLPKIPALEAAVAKKQELIGKLTKEVLRLRGSGKGLTGTTGGSLHQTSNGKASKTESAAELKKFKDFNAGKLDIEDLLGLNQED